MKSEPGMRLREARKKAGFKSASEAARQLGFNPVSYTAHENGGRAYDADKAREYANAFGVMPTWLLYGDADSPRIGEEERHSHLANVHKTEPNLPSAGKRAFLASMEVYELEEFWEMPDVFIKERLRISEQRARVLEVVGDSMYDPNNPTAPGSMYPGDRALVDLDDVLPTPPGVFAVHDGTGVVIKIVETIPHSRPPKLRLSSRNPRYATYECEMHEAGIVGRVKAKVSMIV